MEKFAYDFIDIPQRESKPRTKGLTFVRDPGMGLTEQRMFLESAGDFVDYVKFRNITPRLYRESLIKEKISVYQRAGVRVMSGGIFFQFAWLQRKLDKFFPYLAEIGYDAVEVGYSMLDIPKQDKFDAIARLRALGIEVIYEWGKKFPKDGLDIEQSVGEMNELVAAGVSRIIIEGGEIEQLLDNNKADGSSGTLLVDLANRIGLNKLVFEVDKDPHIAWILKRFGPDVNLGPNLSADQVLWLEPMRRGLGRQVRYSIFDNIA